MAVPTSIQLVRNSYQDRVKSDRKHLLDAISGVQGPLPTGPFVGDNSLNVNVLNLADVEFRCFTDTNTATAPAFNLSTLGIPTAVGQIGVPFSTPGALRKLRLEAFTTTLGATGGGYHETTALIAGGTAPALRGQITQGSGIQFSTERVTARVENNEVIINAQGPSGQPLQWHIRCFVDDQVKPTP